MKLRPDSLRRGSGRRRRDRRPRKLLEYIIANDDPTDLDNLTVRQREILQLGSKGLSNARIAKSLFLSESTVKQHLRATNKVLGVSDRKEAARLINGK